MEVTRWINAWFVSLTIIQILSEINVRRCIPVGNKYEKVVEVKTYI